MAERRIVEGTRAGIVCFISNYSWLDGLSFTAMRERYLDVFDHIWIDNLNGDKYKTGKLTPDGDARPERLFDASGTAKVSKSVRRSRCWCATGSHSARHAGISAISGAGEARRLCAQPRDAGRRRAHISVSSRRTRSACLSCRCAAGETYRDWPLLPDLFPDLLPRRQDESG